MPAGDKVRVLIVDDVADTRENVRRLLQFESDIEVIGAARTAQEGIQLTSELDPDVILGGGVSASFDLLAGPMRREIAHRAFAIPAGRVKVLRGLLGDDAGMLGAAATAWEEIPGYKV